MKTSWNNVRQIERYLNQELAPDEQLIFEAQLLIDPFLKFNISVQKKVRSIIKLYGRKKLRAEIEQVHNRLFQNSENIIFQQRVHQLFKDN